MDIVRIDQHVSRVLNTIQTPEERIQKSYKVAHMYSKVGEFDKALQYIDTYLTSYHNDASAFYLKGFILEKKGRIKDAISAYSDSLKLKPKQKELVAKICELHLDKPCPEAILSHWLEQGRQAGVSQPILQSLLENLALTRGDVQTLERFYSDLLKKNPADLTVCKKLVNVKLASNDFKIAKALIDDMNSRFSHGAVRPLENFDWVQLCYAVYHKAYNASVQGATTPEEGVNPTLEQIILLYGMIDFLSNSFLISISTPDHKESRDILRRMDSHLSTLLTAIEKMHIHPNQKVQFQIRAYEFFANFCQLCSYLILKLANERVYELENMLQLAAVCFLICFSVVPPSLQREAPTSERLLHTANKRMCVVGYLLAALSKQNSPDWMQRYVKPKLTPEGVNQVIEVLELESQDLRHAQMSPSCLRLFLPLINVSQISCTAPSRTHLLRYHESYFRDCYYHLPSLTWLCLAEVTAYDTPPSFPHMFAFSTNRFDCFIDESENLTRTDYPSCSRMDIEAFLYLSVFETQYLDSAENNFHVLLPLGMHSLPIPESRSAFWTSLLTLDEAASNRKLLIKDASKHKTCVEKGLVSIRCLKRMELPTTVLFKIAEAFEHRLLLCRPDSLNYSEERHRCLVTRNELYWGETLRGLDMSEAGVSSLRPDASLSDCLAVKLLSLPGSRTSEGLVEEKSKEIRARAEMALADLALCKNHILKAVSLYEKVELPQAAWNHAQLLKHVALSGDPGILGVTQSRPPTSHDLLLRSHKILSDWTEREAVKRAGLLEKFQSELTSLDKSIHEHQYAYEESPPKSDPREPNGHSLIAPARFLPQATGPKSTSSPKAQAAMNGDSLSNPSLSLEERVHLMEMQEDRMVLALKHRDDVISNLTKKNVELKGIVQNLQFYFTDQKLLFKNPRDPDQAILRPEDLDNLPTPQIPPTVHNLSGRNLSLSNSSPQYPFNNSASSNKSHTPLNSTHRSLLETSHEEDYINESFLSPQTLANQSNEANSLNPHLEYSSEQYRPMISIKGKTQPQTLEETASPFANLQLGGNKGTSTSTPFHIKLPAQQPSEMAPTDIQKQLPEYSFSSNAHPPSPPKQSGFSFKGLNSPNPRQDIPPEKTEGNTSREDYVCTAEYQPLVQLPLVKLETGEELEEVLFCRRAKLFRFKGGEWVEKGVGEMKVLRQRNEQRCRLLMRRDKVMKLCCNHSVLPSLELKPLSSSDRTVTWSTHADFSEVGEPEALTLAIRFKTAELKDEFIAAVEKAKHILKESTEPVQRSPQNSTHKTQPTPPRGPIYMGFGPHSLNRQVTTTTDSDGGDTDILSASSDNGATRPQGPLKIASSCAEQTLFKEAAILTVNNYKEIQNIGSVVVNVKGDPDRAEYRVVIQKENTDDVFCEHPISATFVLQPYMAAGPGKKTDKSCFWTVERDQGKVKYIVRFSTSAISDKFSQVVGTCIENIKSSLSNPSQSDGEFSFSTQNIFESQLNSSSVFGMEVIPSFTFGSQFQKGKGLSVSSGGNSFEQSIPSPTIPGKSNRTIEEKAKESDTSQTERSFEADPYFEPLITLPELTEIRTGEEEEEVMFSQRAKIYRYANKEWKERGVGELKILSNPNTGKYRILMRRDVVKKLCCNHYITSDMKLKKNKTSEKVWVWNTLADFSEESPQAEQLGARFKSLAIVNEFQATFEKCQSHMNGEPKPKAEPDKAGIPTERGKGDDWNESRTSESLTEDVIFVSVTHPTEEQIGRAREFLLPDGFYQFEEKTACSGCRGCHEDFQIVYESELKSDESDTSAPPDQQPPSSQSQTPPRSGAIFGGNIGNLSFSSLLTTPSSGFQNTSGNNSFSKFAKPLFGQSKVDSDTSDYDYEPDPQYRPMVKLEELEEIKTSEEEEEVIIALRSKLYKFVDPEWKERGVGEIKILHNSDTGKYRVLMRRDQVKKICCNHFITSQMELRFLQDSDRSFVWHTIADFSEETPQNEKFAIRFKTPEIAEDFRNAFEKCQEDLMSQTLKPLTSPIAEEEVKSSSSEKNERENSDDVTPAPEVPEQSPGAKEETEDSDDEVIFVSSTEPTPEQVSRAEEFKLPRYFYLDLDKPPCPGCRGCDEDFEIVYESERAIDSPTDGTDNQLIEELRDASEDDSSQEKRTLKGSFFGLNMEGGESFTDLAKSDGTQGFKSEASNPFKAFAKPLFAHNEDIEGEAHEHDPDSDIKPIVQLPELQDLETGEEQEKVLTSNPCTLLRYVENEWKERGKGDIKILHNPDTDKYRIVMRRDLIKKVCCNHYLTAEMKIEVHNNQEKNLIWRTHADFSDEPHRAETFVAAFRKLEMAKGFLEAFNSSIAKAQPEPDVDPSLSN